MALLVCKQKEIAAQEVVVDPQGRMIPATQKWQKISDELQEITKSKVPRNPKMCKDKWNGLHGDYKKVSDYHKGTWHHNSFWDLNVEEKDKLQLPRQFHTDFYNAIDAFQGERALHTNTMHIVDSQVEDCSTIPPEDFLMNSTFNSEYVVHLSDTPTDSPMPSFGQPTVGVPRPGNTCVKRKRNSAFLPVIEATEKSSKVLVDAMDRLNATQQDLEKTRLKLQRKSIRAHLEYLKLRDKKSLKMNKNMVIVLSNLSTAMCHAFIKDPSLILAPVNM